LSECQSRKPIREMAMEVANYGYTQRTVSKLTLHFMVNSSSQTTFAFNVHLPTAPQEAE